MGTVQRLCLNSSYAAVLCDGKVHLHLIIPQAGTAVAGAPVGEDRVFPDKVSSKERNLKQK